MDLLLDTHALLWNMAADPRLSPAARNAIADSDNSIFVSLVSLWEMSIKLAQGRLNLPVEGLDHVLAYLQSWRIEMLPVTLAHVRTASRLPFHHGDPFDRMLVAQAQVEGHRLVSADSKVHQYGVAVLW